MAENKEEKGQEDGGEAKKGKLLPILLGVILVVGAAVGTVAFVMPAGEPGKVEVPAWGEPIVYATPWTVPWTQRQGRGLGTVTFQFEIRARAGFLYEQEILENEVRMKARVLSFLSELSLDQAGGPAGLQKSLRTVIEQALFPTSSTGETEDDVQVQITDVLITNYIPPRR